MYGDVEALSLLSRVSDIYKKGGLELDAHWQWWVSLETAGGYRDPDTAPDLVEEARRWVGSTITYNPEMERRDLWPKYLDELLEHSTGDIREKPSLDDFLLDVASYATAGSGRGLPTMEVDARVWDGSMYTEKQAMKLKRSKYSGYFASALPNLRKLALKRVKQRNGLFPKPDETKKIRTIVTGDQPTFLKQSYLDVIVGQRLAGNPYLPMTLGDSARATAMRRYASSTKGRDWHMPIDQSAFDENVAMVLVLAIVSWLAALAYRLVPTDEVREIGDALFYAMDGGILFVEKAGEKTVEVEIKKGVLSGWKWTALIDSLANYVQFRDICTFLNMPWMELRPAFFGDDGRLRIPHPEWAYALVKGYADYGLKVNPSKFFVSNYRDEFLRMVSQHGRVFGYPARTITGLLFYRPQSSPTAGIDQLIEQIDSWMRLISRGAPSWKVENFMIFEISRVLNISKEDARLVLHTPKALGGMGMYPYTRKEFVGIVPEPERTGSRVLSAESPILQELGFTPRESGEYLTTLIGASLRERPARVRRFELRRSTPALIDQYPPPSYDATVGTALDRPPVARWRERNRAKRWLLWKREAYTRNDFENPEIVEQMRQRLGKRSWREWLLGPLHVSPVTDRNDALTSMTTDAYAAHYWRRIPKIGVNLFKLLTEVVSASAIYHSQGPFIGK
jgi:hypothetical protein